ncbi:MAG: PAS domain-containing protein, partial [Candidatus Firestonebacteria bacterium]|nr:PAS domain-containing protein [Candidatus Firestonebacteria bacterium]
MTKMNLNKYWSKIFDVMDEAIFIIDNEFNIVRANKNLYQLTNFSETDILNKKCFEIIHKSNNPIETCPYIKILKSKKDCLKNFHTVLLDNYHQVRITPIFNNKNELLGAIHLIYDITKFKIMENKLQESEDMLKKLLSKSTTNKVSKIPAIELFNDKNFSELRSL